MTLSKISITVILIHVLFVMRFILIHKWKNWNTIPNHKTMNEHNSVNIHDDIAVYLRMTTADEIFPRLYESVVVQSISYFWPEQGSLFVVLDAERT